MENNYKDKMDEEIKKLSVDNHNMNKGKHTKKIVLVFIIILTLTPVFIYLYSWSINNEEFVDQSESPNQIIDKPVEVKPVEDEPEEEKEKVNLEGKYPIEVYGWASKPFSSEEFWSKDGIYDEIYDSIRKDASPFITAVSWMPASKGDGVNEYTPKTNDVNKKLLDDGFPNPNFSYTLDEDYYKTFIVGVERIINPVFGEWETDKGIERFSDMMEESWWNTQENKEELLDWNRNISNKEGLPSLYDGTFWGEINQQEDLVIKESGSDDLNQPILEVNVPVRFSAFDENGGIVSLEGNLKFTMLSNKDESPVNNRVIFKDIDISIGDLIKQY